MVGLRRHFSFCSCLGVARWGGGVIVLPYFFSNLFFVEGRVLIMGRRSMSNERHDPDHACSRLGIGNHDPFWVALLQGAELSCAQEMLGNWRRP